MSAPIQIVDEQDRPLRAATKQEAWAEGLIHRVVRIMIENSTGQVLLQHRDPKKDIFPNCWDNSVGGHVDAGEDYNTAAIRELEEELGLSGMSLEKLGRYRSDETIGGNRYNRFTTCYRTSLETTPVKLEAGAIDSVRWWNVADIKKMMRDHPGQISDGLRQVIDHYYKDR